ncbi:LOW QUALITY PROTEIN: glutamate receptor ionotropic, delta-2-like [Panulirus ornatus]|uniref:LOW QUALITY PROTEIN: glutamate receptor ionotropic, delta-2-like n=1 Tax=Panulirus ornatus TaxID=150431 RepID=UPI003A87CFE6
MGSLRANESSTEDGIASPKMTINPPRPMEHRRPFQLTALAERVRFVWLWEGGMSTRAIARETGTSATTVNRWIKRWQKEGNVNSRSRPGRRREKLLEVFAGQDDVASYVAGVDHGCLCYTGICTVSTPSCSSFSKLYEFHSWPAKHHPLDLAFEAVDAVLSAVPHPHCSVFLLTDAKTSSSTVSKVMGQVRAPWGLGVFEASVESHKVNATQTQLSRMVDQARRLRQLSWCVTVVVVSDDPAFLAAVVDLSYKSGLLVWPTRLLAVTRLPLPELQALQWTFSMANAMLLIVENTSDGFRCSVYIHLPYSPKEEQALRVASWTPHRGLSLTTHVPLFPDKFSKLPSRPTLVVAVEVEPYHTITVTKDPSAPGGERLIFTGRMANLVDYIARGMNFTYRYVRSIERTFGAKQKDGYWTGMVGMVLREEADFATGPFIMTPSRAEVVDFSWRLWTSDLRLLGAIGRPEVDPWGFALPLAPIVWSAILAALLVVPTLLVLPSHCLQLQVSREGKWLRNTFNFIRILLQQDMLQTGKWSWERLVLGVWMMMTLVLTRSYSGNLMSLLAVRHIPQPYHTLRDVLDDPTVAMIWQKNSAQEQYLRSVKSGIFREIADLEAEGRVKFQPQSQFRESVNTLLRRGDHVLAEPAATVRNLVIQDFSRTGRCDFYVSKEGFLPYSSSLISQKNSPLLHGLSKRVRSVTESGIYPYWVIGMLPNVTHCSRLPKKITVSTSLSAGNLWGMFVVLLGGHLGALLVFCLELFVAHVVYHSSFS